MTQINAVSAALHEFHGRFLRTTCRIAVGADHTCRRTSQHIPANASVTVAFDADNPGRWLLHCHNLLHMATGMMTELAYDDVA